ncbi:hypothetical protein DJ031_04610 [bacterium endosymbiont of Escarpia laminata]|nr:MAG: hypothetical protein DJ031_04610 [bacterium endosymbiont of Escarpia laminata]
MRLYAFSKLVPMDSLADEAATGRYTVTTQHSGINARGFALTDIEIDDRDIAAVSADVDIILIDPMKLDDLLVTLSPEQRTRIDKFLSLSGFDTRTMFEVFHPSSKATVRDLVRWMKGVMSDFYLKDVQ